MDITPIVIVAIIFSSIVAVILGPSYLKSRERRETQATVRAAIDAGQPLPPEVIDSLTRDVSKNLPSRTRDIRRGVIWLAAGVAIALSTFLGDLTFDSNNWDADVTGFGLGLGVIPATIGVAFIILSLFNKNKD